MSRESNTQKLVPRQSLGGQCNVTPCSCTVSIMHDEDCQPPSRPAFVTGQLKTVDIRAGVKKDSWWRRNTRKFGRCYNEDEQGGAAGVVWYKRRHTYAVTIPVVIHKRSLSTQHIQLFDSGHMAPSMGGTELLLHKRCPRTGLPGTIRLI